MDIRAILMGLGFAVIWASAFTSTRMIVTDAPPLMALSLRFALSGGIGILIALAMAMAGAEASIPSTERAPARAAWNRPRSST